MLMLRRVACFLFTWLCWADLETDLYKSAQQSHLLSAVPADAGKIADFVKSERKAKHIALLVHDANCPHCRQALPEVEQVAKMMSQEPVLLGHIDATNHKSAMKTAFDLKGFPCLLFWRQMEDSLEDLVGRTYAVDEDAGFLLRASRLAGLGSEKNKARLALVGQEVIVRKGDDTDMTVQVETAKQQQVWIPHEVLLEKGRRVPYRRADALMKYQNIWEKDLMKQFLQRAMLPLVSPLERLSQLQGQSLVCCGTLTRGFLEAAALHRQRLAAYHAASCRDLPGDHLLVYSPASLQWTALPGRAKAAAALAGPEVMLDDAKLLDWVEQNRYPGITALTIRSVHDWLNGGRPVVLLAVRLKDLDSNALVEHQLREVAGPRKLGEIEVYSYGPSDRYLGVADGTLEGFSYFGVHASDLPRVVVFDDHEHWVEDAQYLQAERLKEHLPRVAKMWRMSNTPRGYVLWVAKQCVAIYLYLDRRADESVGYYGRCLVVSGVAMVFWIQARILLWIAQSVIQMFTEMFESDPVDKEKKDK